jgi:hypothetical protein
MRGQSKGAVGLNVAPSGLARFDVVAFRYRGEHYFSLEQRLVVDRYFAMHGGELGGRAIAAGQRYEE